MPAGSNWPHWLFLAEAMPEPCATCGAPGRYHYAPAGGDDRPRWRCETHQPYNATRGGWNGGWDDFTSARSQNDRR